MLQTKMQPKLLNVNRTPHRPKKRKKITLVFDEKKRREFLTGFRRRKLERKKKAQEELQKQLKEERKKIKQEAREQYKKLLSHRDIPEIQNLLSQQEYETEGHTISILELNVADLAENKALIGENKGVNEEDEDEKQNNENSEDNEDIIGMWLNEKKIKEPKQSTVNNQITNKKDLKKTIKKAALERVKKSKAFRWKQKIERQKNKKESAKKLKRLQEAQKHSGKFKKKKSKH